MENNLYFFQVAFRAESFWGVHIDVCESSHDVSLNMTKGGRNGFSQ